VTKSDRINANLKTLNEPQVYPQSRQVVWLTSIDSHKSISSCANNMLQSGRVYRVSMLS